MADDPRLSCGRSIDDVWENIEHAPDAHEASCPYCQQARRQLRALDDATVELRTTETTDPALQPSAGLLSSVMDIVRAEVRRGQALPLVIDDPPSLTISEQAVVGLVWAIVDSMPGFRGRRCQVRLADDQPVEGPAVVDIELDLTVSDPAVLTATDRLRSRLGAEVAAETGVRVGRIDLHVKDLL